MSSAVLCWKLGSTAMNWRRASSYSLVRDSVCLCGRAVQDVSFRAKRAKRTPGGDAYVDNKQHFREFINRLISNDPSLGNLNGRVLRLKDYVSPDASTAQLDMVIECLKQNVRVEVLYIQNFEKVTLPLLCSNIDPTAVFCLLARSNNSPRLCSFAHSLHRPLCPSEDRLHYLCCGPHLLLGTWPWQLAVLLLPEQRYALTRQLLASAYLRSRPVPGLSTHLLHSTAYIDAYVAVHSTQAG